MHDWDPNLRVSCCLLVCLPKIEKPAQAKKKRTHLPFRHGEHVGNGRDFRLLLAVPPLLLPRARHQLVRARSPVQCAC